MEERGWRRRALAHVDIKRGGLKSSGGKLGDEGLFCMAVMVWQGKAARDFWGGQVSERGLLGKSFDGIELIYVCTFLSYVFRDNYTRERYKKRW